MSAVMKPAARIRRMLAEDVDRVMVVESAAYPFSWTHNIFRDCLRAGYYCCVLEDVDGLVIGHGVMSHAVGECHILNVCIHPDRQSKGLGRYLVQQMMAVARRHGARLAFLEVRVSNTVAFNLYSDLGFVEVGLRKDYYPDHRGREDALILAHDFEADD